MNDRTFQNQNPIVQSKMSEKSEFQIAFDNFQKDITNTLFELASCSDFFRECSTFPLPGPPPTNEATGKTKSKKPKKESNDEGTTKAEKSTNREKSNKNIKKNEKEEVKDKQEKKWTTEEIDEEIKVSSKRTQADLRSSRFMKNLKKRIKNVDTNIIKERIESLLNEGIIENVHKEE